MKDIDSKLRTRLVHGVGAADRVGELAAELGAKRVLLVTDRHIVEAGHSERVERSLSEAGRAFRTYDRAHSNPTTADVDACLAFAREEDFDLFVGLGGGSAVDTAKGCNFLLTNGGRMEDYWGVGKAPKDMLPLIAVPTTAGTGTEVQSFALIAQVDSHQKMACGDPKAAPRVAVLDPTLTVTQPLFVTACTGLDALVHAVETAVTRKRNDVSQHFSQDAFRLLDSNLPRVLSDPEDLDARGSMLWGAAYAGLAIENSMLGAAHSMANPLSAHFDVTHGQAVGTVLPFVVRFNAAEPGTARLYAELARSAGLAAGSDGDDDEAVEALITRLRAHLVAAGMPTSLAGCNVGSDAIDELAAEAARQWTARFNPREVSVADFRDLFTQACDDAA
ncbi:MAG: iron-containing alcohol dehydrogenase [Planctomycetota bacterium]|nr:iron-containing alcohol dehydrogenase [Planctomycetota bacterium]